MTLATNTNLVWRCANTTENYAWIKILSDAFTAVGFVKHTDTGQVDLTGTTVALPTTPSTTYQESGFEIRKLVSSGKPTIYCRVGYGVRVASNGTAPNNNVPCLRIAFGTTTDGVGGLGGVVSLDGGFGTGLGLYNSSDTPTTSAKPWWISSDGQNYLNIVIDPTIMHASSQTNAAQIMGLAGERTINPDTGAYDADGWVVECVSSANAPNGGVSPNLNMTSNYHRVYNITSGVTYGNSRAFVQGNDMFSASGVAGATPLFPQTILIPAVKGPMIGCMWAYASDVLAGNQFSATIYGVVRNYICCHLGNLAISSVTNMSNALRPCIRID